MNESLRTLVLICSALAVVGLPFMACGLAFAPGWANDWPGVSPYVVWSAGMAGVAGGWLFAGAVLVGYPFVAANCRPHTRDRWFARWLAVAAALGTSVGVWIGVVLYGHARAARIWG